MHDSAYAGQGAIIGDGSLYAQKQRAYQDAVQAGPQVREADAAIQRIAQQIENLYGYSQRLSAATDRISGSRPKEAANGAASASNGHIPLSNKLKMLEDALARLNSETAESIERLEGFI